MPAWMEFVMNHDVMRFAQMAVRVFGIDMNFQNPEETAQKGIRAYRKFMHDIGMPVNIEELGAKEQDIPVLAEKFEETRIGDNKTTGGFVKLTKDDAVEIYRLALNAEV
jgi:alcohol dehydrogenase YqhD (iron-dependent ADH family)